MGNLNVNRSYIEGLKIVTAAEEDYNSKTKVKIFNIDFCSKKKSTSISKTNLKPTAQKHIICLYFVI